MKASDGDRAATSAAEAWGWWAPAVTALAAPLLLLALMTSVGSGVAPNEDAAAQFDQATATVNDMVPALLVADGDGAGMGAGGLLVPMFHVSSCSNPKRLSNSTHPQLQTSTTTALTRISARRRDSARHIPQVLHIDVSQELHARRLGGHLRSCGGGTRTWSTVKSRDTPSHP